MSQAATISPTDSESPVSPLEPLLPDGPGKRVRWGRLYGDADALALAAAVRAHHGPLLIIAASAVEAERLRTTLAYFLRGSELPVLGLPDWETLPYDVQSPLPELVSQRLAALSRLPRMARGALVVPVGTTLQHIAPHQYIEGHSLRLKVGERLDLEAMRRSLEGAGYRCVSQVLEHGEFAVRGSILDLFPMGGKTPFRIDLFGDEIDSIRPFDPEDQRSQRKVSEVNLLPAREFPLDKTGVARFLSAYRSAFPESPQRSLIYQDVAQGLAPGGLEYYLPLFFETTGSLFDYLPENTLLVQPSDLEETAQAFFQRVEERYEQRRHDPERPLLSPQRLFFTPHELQAACAVLPRVLMQGAELPESVRRRGRVNFATQAPPEVVLHARQSDPAQALRHFLKGFEGRVLFTTETPGRREAVLEILAGFELRPTVVEDWQGFTQDQQALSLTIAPLERGLRLDEPPLAVITEAKLLGERAQQARRRRKAVADPDQIVRNLTELHEGAPVVHEEQGVGRYLGLQTLEVGDTPTEFLALEYAGGDRLYVPVSSLHLISRYTGASPDTAPLHRLGGEQWTRVRRKAAQKVRDVAAELLDIYARREAEKGCALPWDEQEYHAFAETFPFEETPDQQTAIDAVLTDMGSDRPMDRVVCGDVGFGKTEVALRAAFVATQSQKQVAVLVPTTLLAQQHYQNFSDRFADWPVRVESLSRFSGAKQQKKVLDALAEGKVDILIGTHKLLQKDVKFKELGLVVVDEEHRFGVRHKERLKSLRAQVDLLTLTATPIPRTLNMSMAGIRDLSIIATPPQERHPIKTFVNEWNDTLVQEACLREIQRGGQVYFLHNMVKTIDRFAEKLRELLPEARIEVAHGQMRERQLEQVMLDFYHRRFNILVCTTIIESGIDVPTANTILIDRADKLGLAQLHQLRGRVGRSHHRAYAYLLAPPRRSMTPDAIKRLEAVESLEDLGAGFTLATHDLEIRGAGELLGEDQSGQIQEIGFGLYMELLERAVEALRSGRQPELERALEHGTEVEMHLPALLPDDYVNDVHTRLVLYKRLANARTEAELRDLQVELIDRFGLLPEPAKNLIAITALKLHAKPMGIRRLEIGATGGRILFEEKPNIDSSVIFGLIQQQADRYRFDGGDKLRLSGDWPEATQRLQAAEEILRQLGAKATA